MLDILIRNKARETPGIIQDLAEFAEMKHFLFGPSRKRLHGGIPAETLDGRGSMFTYIYI